MTNENKHSFVELQGFSLYLQKLIAEIEDESTDFPINWNTDEAGLHDWAAEQLVPALKYASSVIEAYSEQLRGK